MKISRCVLIIACAACGCLSVAPLRGETMAKQPDCSGVLDYLQSISGKATVAGIHNKEPNSQPFLYTQRLFKLVGRYPGL